MDQHVLLLVLADNIDEFENRNNVRIENRYLRDASNPFQLPENNFINLFRLNKQLADNLVNILSPHLNNPQRISAVPNVLKILTALFFFSHGSYQKCVGSNYLFGLSQSSVCRCIKAVATAITDRLLNVWVKFPTTEDEINRTKLEFYEKFNFRGVIGCIDCTHVAIVAPPADDPDFPGLAYINRKGYHSINVQVICNANLKITGINTRYPGSVHDAAVWTTSSIYQHLRQEYEAGRRSSWLLGDSGYPLQPWLLTPIVGAAPDSPEGRYTRNHITTRNSVERCIGLLKMRFRCLLRHRTLHYNPVTSGRIIYSCAVLHNMAVEGNIPEPDHGNENIDIDNIPYHGDDNWLHEGRRVRDQYIQNNFR